MYSEDGERRDKNPSIIHHDQREEPQKGMTTALVFSM
jgi:hypothetical protein